MKPVEWKNGKVRFLDQTKLPIEERYVETDDEEVLARAIKRLSIRGAPLIGIAAAYGVVLAANRISGSSEDNVSSRLERAVNVLLATRPTAVNLSWALDRMGRCIRESKEKSIDVLRKRLEKEATAIHEEDAAMCEEISRRGAALLPNGAAVLTHCNTGMLATGGRGTALGIITMAWEQSKLKHVYINETRPLLQGARLTAWELQRSGVPSTLLTDSTAGFLMQRGAISSVIVGADRIAANGDVANKVGTYTLAILAKHHGIPFYVAAPTSTIDAHTPRGSDIPIEQRGPEEVTTIGGIRIAPEGVHVYAPAFDVTPHELITGIITEREILIPPYLDAVRALDRSQMHSAKLHAVED